METSSLLKAAATVSAFALMAGSVAMLAKSPTEIQDYVWGLVLNASPNMTLVLKDEDFEDARVYLCTRIPLSTNRLCIFNPNMDSNFIVYPENDPVFVDTFEGVKLSWIFCQNGGATKVLYYNLTFPEKSKDVVIDSYLPFVFREAASTRLRRKEIVFARRPAVAVFILLESDGETYAVLTEQVRVPTGKIVLELPVWMLDDVQGGFIGTAVREVEEEIGIKLKKEDMVDLTAFLDPSTGHRIPPSPGGCDEEMSVFLYRRQVEPETIRQLQGKETGVREHGEFIKVRLVPYRELWRKTADAKVLMSIALYEMAQREGLVPRH